MKTNQFKVGDRVTASDNTGVYKNALGTISKVDTSKTTDQSYRVIFDANREHDLWCWNDSVVRVSTSPKIVIIPDAKDPNTTLARLYENDKVVKTATATCNATDTYDFTTGAKLAVDRLLGVEVKPTATIIEPKQDKPQYKEVNRVAKAGEWVKIKHTSYWGDLQPNDICQVIRVSDSGFAHMAKDLKKYPNGLCYYDEEYFVLEGYYLFDWQAFKTEKIAVHCDTEEKAKAFFNECGAHDLWWQTDVICSELSAVDAFSYHGKYSCYRCDGRLVWCHTKDYYEYDGYTVVEYPFSSEPFKVKDPLDDYEWVDGYKGFDSDLKCKNYQYEVGKEYDLGAEEKMCSAGFHFCKTLEKTRQFYSNNGTNRFCKVSGLVKKGVVYSDKYCARKIKIGEEVTKKFYNGKVICVESTDDFTVGKIYGVSNGKIIDDSAETRPTTNTRVGSLDELNRRAFGKFIPFLGEAL